MAGLFLLGLGALLWLSADLRDEWRKLDAIDRRLVDIGSSRAADAANRAAEGEGFGAAEGVEATTRKMDPRGVSLP